MAQKLYARIHPEARNGSVPVRLYDVAGIQFSRGGGSYKGWYEVSNDQADRLRRCHVSNGNPNSMRVFQIEEQARVDEISASEARSRMAPEQQRMDVARDREITSLKHQLAAFEPLLALLGNPESVQRLANLAALDKASSGQALSAAESEHVERIAAAPPRRAPMTELDIDDETSKRAAPTQTNGATLAQPSDKKAPASPPARPGTRPGARPGAQAKDDKKSKQEAKEEPAAPAMPVVPANNLPEPLPDQNPIDIAALADDDDDGI
jgi:hypothetical protein